MRRLATIALALVLLGTASTASASARKPLFRTDHQAEVYLEHGLHKCAGINLRTVDFKSAFCINGYYSKHEQRTKKHYPQGRENGVGENVFRSFSCQLSVNDRTFNLYLLTTRRGWRVMVDR
jgi:hypothetical protein